MGKMFLSLSTAKQGDNALGSIHPFDYNFVCLLACQSSPLRLELGEDERSGSQVRALTGYVEQQEIDIDGVPTVIGVAVSCGYDMFFRKGL